MIYPNAEMSSEDVSQIWKIKASGAIADYSTNILQPKGVSLLQRQILLPTKSSGPKVRILRYYRGKTQNMFI
jgi:hypothetical protein